MLAEHWAKGGVGATPLVEEVVRVIEQGKANFQVLHADDQSLSDKVRKIAQEIYRADEVEFPKSILDRFAELEQAGYGHLPVCMAKMQYSFSTDPNQKGAPTGFTISVREVRLSSGAEFIVVLTGDIMTMPGLPQVPAANAIGVDSNGNITGLF